MRKYILIISIFCGQLLMAGSFPVKRMGEGFLYWSQRYEQNNASPTLCLDDSISSLEKILLEKNLRTDIARDLQLNCRQYSFLAGMLPRKSREMDEESRKFFIDHYAMVIYLSGLNPTKKGAYHKNGWWQLSYPVAIKYGLRVDDNIDERLDPVLSSKAASRYYNDLLKEFGSEELSMLAFVYSPIEVRKLQQNIENTTVSKKQENLIRDIQSIDEVFDWILKRMPFAVTQEKEDEIVEVMFNSFVNVEVLLREAQIPEDVFSVYNPSVIGYNIPADYKKPIYLPSLEASRILADSLEVESVVLLDEQLVALHEKRERIKNDIPDPRITKQLDYRVKSGDNLGVISNRYGVRISEIKNWNSLRSDIIYVGQKLVLYLPNDRKEPVVVNVPSQKEKPVKKTEGELKDPSKYIVYKVKSGDTLWGIAKQYPGVSAENIMEWSNCSDQIKLGQELKILKSEIRDE